jgi:hypothetical protein
MSDILWVQKPGNEFGPKMAFLDTLDLLWQIYHLRLQVPITLVLDNARYQKCVLVTELAASLHIEFCIFLLIHPI